MRFAPLAITVFAFGFFALTAADNPPLHLLTSNGVKPAVEQLLAHSDQAIGRHATSEFGTAAGFKKRIEAGEAFDVAVLTMDALDDLTKSGKIAAGSSAPIARAGIGVGYKKGAPKPDVSSAAALKKTLMAAKSVTFNEAGASRKSIEAVMAKLGIADAMKPKIILEAGSGQPQIDVSEGKAELVMTLVPEIMAFDDKGVAVAGPLPADLQTYITFGAGVSAKTPNMDASKALVKYMSSAPDLPSILKAKGLMPR